jgi:hypothetical protein
MEDDLKGIEFLDLEPEQKVLPSEISQDFNRRIILALLLSKFEMLFDVIDAETLNQIIKI